MSIYVCPPTPQTVEGFADKIDTVWKAVLCESTQDERARNAEASTSTRVFPELSLEANYGRPWLALRRDGENRFQQNGSATTTASSRPPGRDSKPTHRRKEFSEKPYSEPPPAMVGPKGGREHRSGGCQIGGRDGSHSRAYQGTQKSHSRDGDEKAPDGDSDGDMSESSLSGDDRRNRERPAEYGNSQKRSLLPGAKVEPSSQKACLGTHTARPMLASKSESYISIARTKPGVRLPTVKSGANLRALATGKAPKRRGRLRKLRLPPPGGYQNAAGNGLMKEMEAHIEDLRASPRARRALEARVWHHLSKRSNRYSHHGRRRGRPLGDSSLGSNDSAGSIGSNGSVEVGKAESRGDDCSSWQERPNGAIVQRRDVGSVHGGGGGGSTSRKALEQAKASVSKRVAAQAIHARQVLRRRRAIEEERSKQVRERSAILKEEVRRPRDKRAEKKRAEKKRAATLMTIVACAIGFAEWKTRYQKKKAAIRQAELEELGARSLQRVWRMSRVRRTLAVVRASKPAVRSIVFSMRMKAAAAKEVVARRHRTQAADLIHTALRAGTRTRFRTRISYYIERIVKCQRLVTSYREVTKARERALINKWTRHVHKLDERRFSMYSAHLRDMYNFDPSAVERFLKEMRLLSAQGQTAAQAMKSKLIPLPGIGSTNTNTSTNTRASGEDNDENNEDEERAAAGGTNDADGKRGGAACNPAGIEQPQRLKRVAGERDPGAAQNRITSVSGNAPKRAKVKLAAGWQKRVVHVHSDVEAQASLMCRRGVKHKEISRALRSVLIRDLLDCARREHRNWCWNHVRATREKERQTAIVNMADIRSVLRTDEDEGSRTADEGNGLLEAKIRAQAAQDQGCLPFNRLEYMQLMNMITDDVVMRFIILAERIEGCVAADGSGRGRLSPEEIREIFVVNRHPNQHENAAAKEAKAELQAWAKERGLTLPVMRRGSTSKVASYHLHQKALEEQKSEKARQVPYFDFLSAVKGGILMDICVPEGQRLAMAGRPHPMSVPKMTHRHA